MFSYVSIIKKRKELNGIRLSKIMNLNVEVSVNDIDVEKLIQMI